MIQVNLLPWREQARLAKKKRFISIFVGFACLSLIILVVLHIYLSSQIRYHQELNDYLQSEINNEQLALNTFTTKADEMHAAQANLRSIISLYSQSFHAIRFLNELISIIPSTVMVEKVVRNGDTITLSGVAQSDSDVTLFLQDIATSPIFNQPVLTEISGQKDITSTKRLFQLSVVQKE